MFDFHEKRKIRSFLYSKFVIGGLFLIAVFVSFSAYDRYTIAKEMKIKLEDRRVQLEEVKNRAQVLETKVEYFENDRGIEEELRNRFDVAKEGEQVVVLIDAKEEPEVQENKASPEDTQPREEEKNWFRDFFRF